MIAPPWIKIPPKGYGGIEMVLSGLLKGLVDHNVEVELFSIAPTRVRGVKNHWLYSEQQYDNIHLPSYESLPISIAHLQFALKQIVEDGKFDIIHDHTTFLGSQVLDWATRNPALPPALHTMHGPPFSTEQMLQQGQPDNKPMWQQLGGSKRLFYAGISSAYMNSAPESMKDQTVKPVHNAVDVSKFRFEKNKSNYFITLARFNHDKGQHIAARLCAKLGYRLRMAGTVASINTPRKLILELANPLSRYRNMPDFRYYSDNILPLTIRYRKITYTGNIEGERKLRFISRAKALLFPIDWEEPFGMAVIEALASGTPVIAMNRGAMPEIIEHGKNGFLAENEEEFAQYMGRVDEIDPEECRRSVELKFSADKMAIEYTKRYRQIIKLANK